MPDMVVDASVLASMIFIEERSEEAATRLDDVNVVAPTILSYELANIAVSEVRRGLTTEREAILSLSNNANLGIDFVEVDRLAVAELAIESGLSAYDVSYLWTASVRNLPLVTFDRRLEAAAKQVL